MTKLLIVIVIVASTAVIDGGISEEKFVEEGTKAVLPFSFVPVNNELSLYIDILHSKWIRQENYEYGSFYLSERLKVTHDSDGVLKIYITNVSKSDQGQYCVSQRNTTKSFLGHKCIVLLTKLKNLHQYDETVILKDNSNFTLKFKDHQILESDWEMFTFKYNGSKWTRLASNGRFNILYAYGCKEYAARIISKNVTTEDEGIYWYVFTNQYSAIYYEEITGDHNFVIERYVRLLIKNLNFKNQIENVVTIGTEGDSLSLVCEINSDYQVTEMYIETRGIVMISGDPPMINYTFVPSREDHLSFYKCSARIWDHPSTIDTITQLVINHDCLTETDGYLIISSVVAFLLFLYIIVLQILCCQQRKHLRRGISQSTEGTEDNEYYEIETVNYHSASIPRQLVSEFNFSDPVDNMTQSDTIVRTVNQVDESRQINTDSSRSDCTSSEEVNDNSNQLLKHRIRNSDNTGTYLDVEYTSNQVWKSYSGTSSDTPNVDVEEKSNMACSNIKIESHSKQVTGTYISNSNRTSSGDNSDQEVAYGSRKTPRNNILISNSVSSCDTFNQQVDISFHQVPETEVRKSDTAIYDDTFNEGVVDTSNSLPRYGINNSDIAFSGDTINEEVAGISPVNEHVYNKLLDIRQAEHTYSDCNRKANQKANVKKNNTSTFQSK